MLGRDDVTENDIIRKDYIIRRHVVRLDSRSAFFRNLKHLFSSRVF
jgi:hypothetical protein